jgi:signal transduction histidine kinase
MAGWSIRRKLGLLVTIPLIVLLVGGGVLVASLGVQYQQARTASNYADAILPTLRVSSALDAEFANPGQVTDKATLTKVRANTDKQIKALRPYLDDLRSVNAKKSNLPIAADSALTSLESIDQNRKLVDRLLPALVKVDVNNTNDNTEAATANSSIAGATTTLRNNVQALIFSLTGEMSVVSPDRNADKNATFVSNTSLVMQKAVAERTLSNGVLNRQTTVTNDRFATLTELIASQGLGVTAAKTVATPEQAQQLQNLINLDSGLGQWRTLLQTLLGKDTTNPSTPIGGDTAFFNRLSGDRLKAINDIIVTSAEDTQSAATGAKRASLIRVAAVAIAVLLTLGVVSALLAAIARTVTVPLRKLRQGAVEIASVQLPAAVARIEQDGVGADVSLPPVLPADAYAGPETLEVARAVDDLGAEAVRLATAQVRLRRALDEAFVSMSRRSQSMVEKQLAIIDELESQEQDPDQLRNLFRLDHLAARMRRYNDNLLVLAGSAVRTRATAPVKIAELFRAATSEMEQYERVRLQPVSGASIAGTVAGELVHLLAELLDNAAMYSPPSSAIVLSAAFTADGGLQIEVLDAGVGISPGELDRLNGRLTQPESIDTQVPSRMGLFVVARLARRGTFGVMLQSRSDASGTVALVRVPATLVIGAPGSTGEQPMIAPSIPQRQIAPTAGPQFSGYAPPVAPMPQRGAQSLAPGALSPAAAAAAVAAQEAAGVRSVADGNAPDASLPRRRRTAAGSNMNMAGLPPEAIAAANNPAVGLFTPITPPEAAGEDGARNTGAIGIGRPAAGAPGTSPTGISGMQSRTGGLPTRGQTGSQPVQPAWDTGSQPVQEPWNTGSQPTQDAWNTGAQPVQPWDAPPFSAAPPTGSQPVQQPWDAPPFSAPATGSQPVQPWDAAPFSAQPDYQREQLPARPETPSPDNHFDTPAAGITGLPGLAPPVRRDPSAPLPIRPGAGSDQDPGQAFSQNYGQNFSPEVQQPPAPPTPQPYSDPLTAPTGAFRQPPNQGVPVGQGGGGQNGWEDDDLPTELAARAAAAAGYRPNDPNLPMIGEDFSPDFNDPTPIFDQISVWFTADPAESAPAAANTGEQIIDLRGEDERRPSNRWASRGDQRWLATNARAAAAPDTEGTLETGLPKRRPGANLLPSAVSAAATPASPARPAPSRPAPVDRSRGNQPSEQNEEQNAQDAAVVRGRLGSYQRGLANARRARTQSSPAPAFDPVGASLFTVNSEAGENADRPSGEQGGDQ